MGIRRVHAVALGLVLFLAAGPVAAERLTFAWPVPSTVTVTERAVRKGTTAVMRYQASLAATPDGKLSLRLANFEFVDEPGAKKKVDARTRKQMDAALKAV